MLSNSPGAVGFELAPFKLPSEYLDILGGIHSTCYRQFIQLLTDAFLALRRKADWLVGLVEMMEQGKQSHYNVKQYLNFFFKKKIRFEATLFYGHN
jgi:phosphatidylinositol kinase/protein kinase (PI-3  family)